MKNKLLHAAFFTPTSRGWGLPLLLWSPPGMAKTSVMRQLADSMGIACEVLSPGERGEGAFGCVPVPEMIAQGMVLTYPAPQWISALAKVGLVLVDELTTAPPALQPALLGLLLDGRIGGATLAARVRIFGAANPVECSANGDEISAPGANRLCHMPWSVSAAEVAAYFCGTSDENEPIDIDAEELRVMALWPVARAKAAGIISAFLVRHPDLLHKMPIEGDPQRGKAWPSPRSWDMALRALASAEIHNLNETETDVLCSGCVGDAAWGEFREYQVSMDLPDPIDVLDYPGRWQPDNRRLDRTAAVIASCLAIVVPKSADKRKERGVALWSLLDIVGKAGARDITLAPAQALLKAGIIAGAATQVMAEMKLSGMIAAMT